MMDLRAITRTLVPLFRGFLVITLLVAVLYPVLLLGIGQAVFPHQANGSPMTCNGTLVGSRLLGQNVTSPKLFHPRNASDSASGVDPHITPEAAFAQIPRISSATAIPASSLQFLVQKNIDSNRAENLGLLAPGYVNVNDVNLSLIQLYPRVYPEFCR